MWVFLKVRFIQQVRFFFKSPNLQKKYSKKLSFEKRIALSEKKPPLTSYNLPSHSIELKDCHVIAL